MIFVKYRDEAHEVVEVARREARQLRHNYIGTEHLLLALTATDFGIATRVLADSGVTAPRLERQVIVELEGPQDDDLNETDAQALANVGIDLHEVRRRIEETFGPSALDRPPLRPTATPLTDKGLRALKATSEHARRLSHRQVGPEHLLLALLDDENALAVKLICRLGTSPESLRDRTLAVLRETS